MYKIDKGQKNRKAVGEIKQKCWKFIQMNS